MLAPTIKIDTTGLVKGLMAARLYTKRSMPEIVNSTAFWIAMNAFKATPSVEPAKIEQELRTIVLPRINIKTGKQRPATELGNLIVMARMNPESDFNKRTNQKWFIPGFTEVQLAIRNLARKRKAAGWTAKAIQSEIARYVTKMIKSRKISTNFLKAGWIPAIKRLGPLVRSYSRLHKREVMERTGRENPNLGSCSPAIDQAYVAAAIISNEVGLAGPNAAGYNEALQRHGVIPLQNAIDREGKEQMDYALKKMHEDLVQTVKPHWN
jgi:hypothetical protein